MLDTDTPRAGASPAARIPNPPVKRKGQGNMARRNLRNGLLFASPWIVGFVCFTLYPLVASMYYSLCAFSGLNHPVFIGLENYRQIISDELFTKSLGNTMYMVIVGLPLSLIAALALAMLLNQKVRGISVYRTIYYLPSLVPAVASAILWMWLLNPEIGLINRLLAPAFAAFHSAPPAWLGDPHWAKPALVMMGVWGAGGSVIIYLAGLQDVPTSLYEAADLDGATAWAKFRNVTVPMISPIIFFNLIMGIIGTFQYFTQAFVMTQGGPQDATMFYALRLFNSAFIDWKMGYASAMAWILFAITLVCTIVVMKTSGRWVYYGGGDE
ncbi:MAG TPA: sugar ABC transporter permease [Armatimonadota bacterium]|jgi:multiple sugar transport system permease protein